MITATTTHPVEPRHTCGETDPWTAHMRRGDFASAWKICDEVLRSRAGVPCAHLPRHFQYIWDGTPLAGKRVLVRCYHGLGDTIMFIRFAPMLKTIAREVIVWAQPALLPILRTAAGIDRLLPLHDGTPDVDYDVDVESMELAHVFRISGKTLPHDVPYLHVAPASFPRDRLNVGVVWSGGNWNDRRRVPLRALGPLFATPGVRFHALQRGAALREWTPAIGPISGTDDVVDAARVMRALDLVISVDSFPVHLAGALGVPIWILLTHEADWRWMKDRDDSPWYPTARLFRQSRPDDWSAVVERMAGELSQMRRVILNPPLSDHPSERTMR